MAIDSRYVLGPPLQYIFLDKDTGLPLAGGKIYFWEDEARTIPKAVFSIQGTPPDYTYIQLANPMTLSAIGTMSDGNNDIATYFFPQISDIDDTTELYFIDVYSSVGVFQFSRQAWPNIGDMGETQTQENKNYIPNGQFLIHTDIAADPLNNRVAGQISNPITYIGQGGWTFERPVGSTAIDIVTFTSYGSYVPIPTASPRFYCTLACQSPSAGDDFKDLRLKFPDVNKFASTTQKYTFAFSASTNTSSTLDVQLVLIKNFGTGGDATTETLLTTFVIQPSEAIYQKAFVFGVNTNKNIGDLNDDYIQFSLRVPSDIESSYNVTDAILFLGNINVTNFPPTPNAEFLYQSLPGWLPVPAHDGSDLYLNLRLTPQGLEYDHTDIGKIFTKSTSTVEIDELECDGSGYPTEGYSIYGIPYSRLQNKYFDASVNFPRYGTGQTNLSAYQTPITTQLFVTTNFPGLCPVTVDGTVPTGFIFSTAHLGVDYLFGASTIPGAIVYCLNDFAGAYTAATAGTSGFTVNTFRMEAGVRQLVTIATIDATTLAGKYFKISSSFANFYMWFTVDGTGADPTPGGTAIRLDLRSAFNSTDVANLVSQALSGNQITMINFLAGASIPTGSYFNINSLVNAFYVWYQKDGVGSDPNVSGRKGIKVSINSANTGNEVAILTQRAINSKYFAVPDYRGAFLRGWNNNNALGDPNSLNRSSNNNIFIGDEIGTIQLDEVISHRHAFLYGSTQQAATGVDEVTIDNTSELTTAYGGAETRPINTYVLYVVKY